MVPEENLNFADRLLAAGWLPDSVIRFGIRRLLARRLADEDRGGDESSRRARLLQFVENLKQSPIAVHTPAANVQHYEVPTRFYQLVLGRRLKYSAGHWPAGVGTLDASEEAMLALTCERARIADGQTVLDLGCGWGSLSFWITEKFPNCRVLAVSNSGTQKEHIDAEIRKRGISSLAVVTADMNAFETDRRFDRIVSVEMFEHMRNYEKLLAGISRWLDPAGLLFIHIFVHRRFAYCFEDKGGTDWMSRHFFTGGMMPSDDLLPRFQKDVRMIEHWPMSGRDYARTSEAWLDRMDQNEEEILSIFSEVYGARQARRWWSYWRIFFMSCAELWGYRGGGEWGVSHYLFENKNGEEIRG